MKKNENLRSSSRRRSAAKANAEAMTNAGGTAEQHVDGGVSGLTASTHHTSRKMPAARGGRSIESATRRQGR
jgi:hypothetical protein